MKNTEKKKELPGLESVIDLMWETEEVKISPLGNIPIETDYDACCGGTGGVGTGCSKGPEFPQVNWEFC